MNTTTTTTVSGTTTAVVDDLRRLLDTAKAEERQVRETLAEVAQRVNHLKVSLSALEKAFGVTVVKQRVTTHGADKLPDRLSKVLQSDPDCNWTADLVFARYCKAYPDRTDTRSRVVGTLRRMADNGKLVSNGDCFALPATD